MKADKILLVEDDATIASGLVYVLENEGYSVVHAKTVREARAAAAAADVRFSLAILDMQLPDGSGFDVREALKPAGTATIFLTVVDDEGNIVRAFEGGADDYITKPFRLRELLARIDRVLNRKAGAAGMLALGSVSIDTAAGKAFAGGAALDLTALEYRLLLIFANNKGQILSRPQILERLWDAAGGFVEDNTLTVYIKRLRGKLGGAAKIETIRGLGYRAD
ncbi:MAG: response regulator transcription factor [Clostridiales Family XIII bacterium]|jgi:DNA-binding response OmpR family regulator|nr:response regulator transcription factor [Clostridiales Family XIII bacterium]